MMKPARVPLWNHSLQDGYFFPQSPTGLSAFLPFSELLGCSSGEEPAELQPGFKVQTKHDLGSGTMMFSLLGRKGRDNNPDIWFPIFGVGGFFGPLLCSVFMVPSSRTALWPLEGGMVRALTVILCFKSGLAVPLQADIFIWLSTFVSQMSLFFSHCLLSVVMLNSFLLLANFSILTPFFWSRYLEI